MFQFGEADAALVAALKHHAPACEVIQPERAPSPAEDEPIGPLGADPGTVWPETELNDEVIKRYRPYSKAVGVFAARGMGLRQAKELLSVVRHGLPVSGELHLIELAASKSAEWTVADLLRKAGFKVVERMSAIPTWVGVVELYKALKQPAEPNADFRMGT